MFCTPCWFCKPRRTIGCTLVLVATVVAAVHAQSAPDRPKNVIVFIADGCGESTQCALELWRGEPMIYQSPEWTRYDATTYPLRPSARPSRGVLPLEQDERYVYNNALATDATPDEGSSLGYPFYFRGYRWLRATAPDSANTATSIFTGVSTYRGAIDVDGEQHPVPAVSRAASEQGKAVGIVTSVPFSHATPACAASAHVPRREMYHEITHQMLTASVCTVIAGGGHPEYDDNANHRETPRYTYISKADWTALKAGTVAASDSPAWTLVDDTEEIRRLAEGNTPERLFILAPVAHTLQQMRTPHIRRDSTPPGGHPRTPGVPTLQDLTLATLNVLDNDPDGFFLMVEGGAVDWAMHDTEIGRMIEEMIDFHSTVETVCALIDSGAHGFDWSNTLVVVTADHDHLLFGPESDTVPFQPLEDRGPGVVPGHLWHADSHSNLPVPLFVRGVGADRFADIPTTRAGPKRVFHQTAIGGVLFELVGTPRPAENHLQAEE